MHSTTSYSSFEIAYVFNPLNPLELLALPVNERNIFDGEKKVEMVRKLHESVRQHIDRNNEQYTRKTNKGQRRIVFESRDSI